MRSPSVPLAFAVLLAALLPVGAARGQGTLATADDPRDQVELRAELDPVAHRIAGTLRWRFTNRSARATAELYWHLYPNAFRTDEQGGSVFVREEGSAIRDRRVSVPGSITLTSLSLGDGRDLLARSTLDVGVPDDTTQLRTDLYEPLAPGESIELRATFVTALPVAVARSGYVGDFHVAGQWFPKLARLEPDGTWAHFPYHGLGEFYADFADYTLTVAVPPDVVVVAGGDASGSPRDEAGLRVYRFVAQAVHDCVFVASPTLTVIEEEHPLPTHTVRVRVAHGPGFDAAAREYLRLTRSGLDFFSQAFGEYPYATLTVVVPPSAASALAGMEYPMLFLTAGPWWGSARPLFGGMGAETTVHELAHQWFQGLLATHEVRYPALDEGLASWAADELLRAREGHGSGARLGAVTLDVYELERSWGLARVTPRSPLSAAYDFDAEGYFRTVYVYVPLALETIARAWGRERLLRALGRYARAQRLSHPGPDALREAFRTEYGDWFVRDVFDAVFVRGCTAHTELGSVESVCDDGGCRAEIIARRTGCLPVPLEVEVESTEGRARYAFSGSARELRLTVDPQTLRRVQVDPGHRNLTDPRRIDDVQRFGGADGALFASGDGARLSTRLLALFHVLFAVVGP